MTNKRGTGDELLQIDLGEFGHYSILDDGDDDSFVTRYIVTPDGEELSSSISSFIKAKRKKMNDEEVLQKLASGDGTVAGRTSPGSPGGGFDRQVSFKCDGCGTTWPGTQNETPHGDEDTCPNCADD